MTYLVQWTASNWTLDGYLAQFDARLLSTTDGRRALTELDPLLFALIYFRKHLRSGDNHDGPVTLADFHLDMCRRSRQWIDGGRHRDAEVAPRDSGKSTWNFLIRPTWALAHKHRTYVAAFADSGPQAEQHLSTFKNELRDNHLLRMDYPELCEPKVRLAGINYADNRKMYISSANQVFMAKGIDASSLGAKQFEKRPDLLLFDDIEPDASNYSELKKDNRCHSMIASVMYMNLNAAVLISGTVTMHGSVVHDLVRTVLDPGGTWTEELAGRPSIIEEGFTVNYYPALYDDPDTGLPRSVWPQRWSVEFLQSIQHTAAFWLNFMNDPRGQEGGWWTASDFHYGRVETATRWILQLDPAVTTKRKSDWTGVAVVGYSPPSPTYPHGQCEVAYARKVKMVAGRLRDFVLQVLEWFPEVRGVRIEVNQGGETWVGPIPEQPKELEPRWLHAQEGSLLFGVPVPVQVHTSSVAKEVRLNRGLSWYQRPGYPHILHRERFTDLENTMISYPNVAFDDLIDAVVLGELYFFEPPKRGRVGAYATPYV